MNKLKAYTGERADVAQYVPESARRILDVGCSNGAFGAALKAQSKRTVVGIEGDEALGESARSKLNEVIVVDLNEFSPDLLANTDKFDTIVLADVLEHLLEPTKILKQLVDYNLAANGNVVISLPNVSHILTFRALLKKTWPKHEHGLFDRTHLRWFGLHDIYELLERTGLSMISMQRNYRIVHDWKSPTNRYARYLSKTPLRDYITYQYVVNAKIKS